MQDDDGIRNIPRLIREKEIWNEAIEAAAKAIFDKEDYQQIEAIRKLKK